MSRKNHDVKIDGELPVKKEKERGGGCLNDKTVNEYGKQANSLTHTQ